MFLVNILALAVIVGLARGGRLLALAGHRWHLPALPLAAVLLQVVGFLPDEAATAAARTFAAVAHVGSYALALIFIWANRRTPWLWLMAVGVAANAAAIMANGGFMPVRPGPTGGVATETVTRIYYNNAVLMGPQTPLWFLGDILPVRLWSGQHWIVSAGDLAIAAAAFALVQRLMQPTRPGLRNPAG